MRNSQRAARNLDGAAAGAAIFVGGSILSAITGADYLLKSREQSALQQRSDKQLVETNNREAKCARSDREAAEHIGTMTFAQMGALPPIDSQLTTGDQIPIPPQCIDHRGRRNAKMLGEAANAAGDAATISGRATAALFTLSVGGILAIPTVNYFSRRRR